MKLRKYGEMRQLAFSERTPYLIAEKKGGERGAAPDPAAF